MALCCQRVYIIWKSKEEEKGRTVYLKEWKEDYWEAVACDIRAACGVRSLHSVALRKGAKNAITLA